MEQQPRHIDLPAECTSQWASAFHESRLQTGQMDGDFLFNAAAVERITTPAVQLLVALARALALEGHSLGITEASEPFRAAIRDLGLGATASQWGVK
jgi:anti-anti-sigma regulatory factor